MCATLESASQEEPASANGNGIRARRHCGIEAPRVDSKGAVGATAEAQAIMDCLYSLPVERQDALSHDPGR
jgi:hypothetical protein